MCQSGNYIPTDDTHHNMADKTIRDKIWIKALNQVWIQDRAIERQEFTERRDASEKTVRNTLEAMAASPYLNKDRRNGKIFYVPGPAFVE